MEVTIVIPFRNRAETLRRTVESIPLRYPLILVDNGSTDDSLTIARQLCEERGTQAATILLEEPTPGAPAARNCGLDYCLAERATEWIYFFDSDDVFTALPEVDDATVAECDMICFPVRMVVGGQERIRDHRPTADPATHVLSAMLGTQSMLFRAEWLRSIGAWDNRCRIWNDWELGLRALLHRPRLRWFTAEAFHHIYVHDDSITGPSYSARWEAIRDTLAVAYGDAKDNPCVRRALDLRTHIVCGRLRREGASEAAASLRSMVSRSTLLGRCLEHYVALGGRGAWRLAMMAVHE